MTSPTTVMAAVVSRARVPPRAAGGRPRYAVPARADKGPAAEARGAGTRPHPTPLEAKTTRRIGRCCFSRGRSHDCPALFSAQLFEEGKETTTGLHFLSIQSGPEADAPDGFWLLKDFETVNR